jgi:S1-C subfamily serine protease
MIRSRVIALAFACAVAAVSGCAKAPDPAPSPSPPTDPFVATFRALRPAVVLFTMTIPSDDPKRAKRGLRDDAYGSGVVIASDARGSRILTVEHVIHGARDLHATLDERQKVRARVLAADERDDLALVAIDVPNRPVAHLGRSTTIDPGTQVGVAGYPVPDEYQDEHLVTRTSVFFGRVSSVRNDTIELELPIIPGESGGPIFEAANGLVIGLAQSRFDDEHAIGFAVPIEDALRFLRGKI